MKNKQTRNKYNKTGLKTVIRYQNRKLYDTQASAYITTADLLAFERGSFQVIDRKTNGDITKESLFTAFVTNVSEDQVENVLKFFNL